MIVWHDIHRNAWAQLQRARQDGRLPHALLLTGPAGIGKLDFAEVLASSLLCDTPRDDGLACGACTSCTWHASGNHPDFRLVQPDSHMADTEEPEEGRTVTAREREKKSDQIRIDQVRELQTFLNVGAHRAGRRVVVLHPGDFQVAPVTMEVAARSGYYKIMANYGHKVPMVDETAYPYSGSAIVSIDFGNSWSEVGNVPPGPEDGLACGADLPQADGTCRGKSLCDPQGTFAPCKLEDPHDRAHGLQAANDQLRWFYDKGEIKDFCGGDGCKPE